MDNILKKNSPFIISEIGINHNGDKKQAIKLIKQSKKAGADSVKFQIRDLNELYPINQKDSFGLGSQYIFDIVNKFDLKFEDYCKLFEYVKKKNSIPLCTPFDLKSVSATVVVEANSLLA